MVKEQIVQIIKQIEMEYDIKILFACESGSRAWGFPSENSDYDVRFIYVHKVDWYLSIDLKRDVLEIPKHDPLSIPVPECLDMSGWDLIKTLRLYRKSNPTVLEWLNSSIVYIQPYSVIKELNRLSKEVFNPMAVISHYMKMAKGNDHVHLQHSTMNTKRMLNVLRPLIAAKWAEKYSTFPPVEFQSLLMGSQIPDNVNAQIQTVLKSKMEGEILNDRENLEKLNQFIEDTILYLENVTKGLNIRWADPTEQLNHLLRKTLAEVW